MAVLCAAALLAGCGTDRDPRTGGFIDGVANLSTGGYDAYVKERRAKLDARQEESQILEARARAITAEREALDRELEGASGELTRLQDRLDALQSDLATTHRRTDIQRRKLAEAKQNAERARKRIRELSKGPLASVEARRRSVDDLKALIGSVAAMVEDLSG